MVATDESGYAPVQPLASRPLHNQLFEILKELIETSLGPGQALPSERRLAKTYGVSRTTVRAAIRLLQDLGYVYGQQGKGTFVASREDRALNLSKAYSFTEQMRSLGKKPETRVMKFEVVEPVKSIADAMNLTEGESVIKLKRQRLADGIPMMIERSYLPRSIFATLTRERLDELPLYVLMELDFSQKILYADEEFTASLVSKYDAEPLEMRAGAPVLLLRRTTVNVDKEVVEYTTSVARPDRFKYMIRHQRNYS